jgi:DNA modification methylase
MSADIERLFGRAILSYSPPDRERLIEVAKDYWRAAGFPYPTTTQAKIQRDISNLVSSDRLLSGYYHGFLSTVGLRTSNVSHPYLWHIKTRGKSCVDIFDNDARLTRALAKAPGFWPDRRCWSGQSVRTLMRISHKMRPSNFRPVVARQLVRAFSADGARVLDFSAGFGGRLLGVVSLDRFYVGIDPAIRQIAGLHRLYCSVRRYVPGKAELYHACAEDLLPEIPDRFVDLIISSPPYFDREKYSEELSQSYLRYPQFSNLIDHFFAPVLRHSTRTLKPGGLLLLNVTDHPDFNLKDISIELCKEYVVFAGWIPYPMRSNPVRQTDPLKREPILVFQKPPLTLHEIRQKIRFFGGFTFDAFANTLGYRSFDPNESQSIREA